MTIVKTDKGQQVLKDRSLALSQHQRSALIMFDGKRSVEAVLKAGFAGLTRADIDDLMALGLLVEDNQTAAKPLVPTPTVDESASEVKVPDSSVRSDSERYQEAYLLATQLTASLGLRGFRLNLAVEAVGNYDELLALSPRIKDAVGAEKFGPLARALVD